MSFVSNRFRFITGNDNKFAEAQAIIPSLERLAIDLPEIQSLDSQDVVAAKLKQASRSYVGTLIAEDVSLSLDCLGGSFPGALIKWQLKAMGPDGIHGLAERYGVFGATAVCVAGCMTFKETRFFKGSIRGTIVAPRDTGKTFGWDPIFLPDNHLETFSQMALPQKNAISHRAQAFRALKAYLDEAVL